MTRIFPNEAHRTFPRTDPCLVALVRIMLAFVWRYSITTYITQISSQVAFIVFLVFLSRLDGTNATILPTSLVAAVTLTIQGLA